jgi:hypothetical protein
MVVEDIVMSVDFYLRFPDAATALSALAAAGMVNDGQPVTANHSWALDLIGPLGANTAYHVNLRYVDGTADLPVALQPYSLPKPAVEKRVWA